MLSSDVLKVLRKMALLALPIGILLFYVEYNLSKISNSYNQKRRDFETRMPEIETLVLGSSQSLNAVNPSFLSKKAHNLANTSQSLYYDIALTEKYLDKMPKLKTVCVGIAYFSFFGEMEDTDEEWRTFYYRYFWDISCPNTEKLDARKYSLIALYGNFTALKYASKNWKINEIPLLQQNGFMPKDSVNFIAIINDKTGLERCQIHQREKTVGKREIIEKNLEKFVENLTKNHSKNVLFYSTPTYKTYSQFLDKNDVENNQKIIAKLCEKYGCKYLDFSNDSRFVISDFANNDHLNESGATKFSQLFDAILPQN